METRLCNIFEAANAITLAKTVLESPYKVLQVSSKRTVSGQPARSSKVVQFLSPSKV